jgi:radical SAM superfamily enzyme YgiQ (UPF0313 family)
MKVALISTYELGRQPFGLASPARWLRTAGAEVVCLDLSREALREEVVRAADLVAFYVPMHTATRLAVALLPAIRELNPRAHLCFYGLYAPVNEAHLRRLGAKTILGGEFEQGLKSLVERLAGASGVNGEQTEPLISVERQKFLVPERGGMVPLEKYARLVMPGGETRTVGYTEASRGCKHLCRHCPIVPVYQGVFRVVDRDVVMEDIRRQVAAGAQHITFGDPDFFNGIGHALPIVEELHREFPQLTYDATIKIEHLLKHRDALGKLRETGCAFVTSAVESTDDAVLEKLEKNHTRSDFLEVVRIFRDAGMVLEPTFVPFTPWTTVESYCDLLDVLRENDLVQNVAPIQLAIRLLIPAGSRLLELEDVRRIIAPFDPAALAYPWKHPDARMDKLCEELQSTVHAGEKMNRPRARIFERVKEAVYVVAGERRVGPFAPAKPGNKLPEAHATGGRPTVFAGRMTIPYINEPWYC